ncbi:MAG TPA: AAA family ATPase [Armatimonadota bacterium]|jgi:t-SNARE complex subunit (syntaxin)
MSKWYIDEVQVSGGFLPGFLLRLPRGLTCVIGPRGSGKSTLAEAIRYGIGGITGATRPRLDLIQANLGDSIVSLRTSAEGQLPGYHVQRSFRKPAVVTSDNGAVTAIDLDRGTFLPIDGYSSAEIEAIADESVGEKRRSLLDDLRARELGEIQISLATCRRLLEANADQIRAIRRSISDFTEGIEELAEARPRLDSLPAVTTAASTDLLRLTRGIEDNESRTKQLESLVNALRSIQDTFREASLRTLPGRSPQAEEAQSPISSLLREGWKVASAALEEANTTGLAVALRLDVAIDALSVIRSQMDELNARDTALVIEMQELNRSASLAVQERSLAEQAVAHLDGLERERDNARARLTDLLQGRSSLKADYLVERDRISCLREEVATQLQADAGTSVRIRVLRNADALSYQQMLMEGLKGARVRNHEDILSALMRLRPEQLAQIVLNDDLMEFEHQVSLGTERSRRILDAFRQSIDPLSLEVSTIEDRIAIELNVSSGADPNFKDASELSRGQKCTALLPLLLARRETPLVIDQPEDNLDNHFIYATVVEVVRRLKMSRQMIFITHNANIPVLAEADLVVVLNSDGRKGYIEKMGSLDECQDEIIDLLEGGREAFELRRQRYDRVR